MESCWYTGVVIQLVTTVVDDILLLAQAYLEIQNVPMVYVFHFSYDLALSNAFQH